MSPARLVDAYRRLMTDEVVKDALDDRLCRLELRGLQIRTLDAHIYPLGDARSFLLWQIESGDARLLSGKEGTILSYQFPSAAAKEIVLCHDFEFPADPADLHKVMLSVRPDDSWHRLDATLDVAGIRFASRRTSYLAQHRPQSIIFQPPTHDDSTFQPKTWVPLDGTTFNPENAANAGNTAPFFFFPLFLSLPIFLSLFYYQGGGGVFKRQLGPDSRIR